MEDKAVKVRKNNLKWQDMCPKKFDTFIQSNMYGN